MKNIVFGEYFFSLFILLFLLYSCDYGKGQQLPNENIVIDTIPVIVEEEEPKFVITYKLDSIANMTLWDSLYSREEQKLILALNRIEKVKTGSGSKLIIPDTLKPDLKFYSPFPEQLGLLDSIPKTLLISQRIQAFALYENGKLLRWGPVSSGKESTPTPNGLHYANYKAKRKISTVNSTWIMPYYFNFMNFYGVGIHQYVLPGYPASHACVRLDMDDAMFIYDWANQWRLDSKGRTVVKNGTPFMVFGEYDFQTEITPWTSLASDPESNFLNSSEIETITEYVKAYSKDPRNFGREGEKAKDIFVSL